MIFKKGHIPWNKEKKHPSARNNPQVFKKGHTTWNKGLKRVYSKETLEKMSQAKVGRLLSKEHKGKISKALQGHPNYLKSHSEKTKRKIGEMSLGKKNGNWRGDKVGYDGLHRWVKYHLGRPKQCEFCGNGFNNPCQIHWANKSGEYKRDLSDWLRLCAKCHKQYDLENDLVEVAPSRI